MFQRNREPIGLAYDFDIDASRRVEDLLSAELGALLGVLVHKGVLDVEDVRVITNASLTP